MELDVQDCKTNKKLYNLLGKLTYWLGTIGVMFTSGCTTFPMAKIPPPFTLSKQCANIFFTFPDETSWESMDEFDFPNPRIPSKASSGEIRLPYC